MNFKLEKLASDMYALLDCCWNGELQNTRDRLGRKRNKRQKELGSFKKIRIQETVAAYKYISAFSFEGVWKDFCGTVVGRDSNRGHSAR
jgi:hypothetical protein